MTKKQWTDEERKAFGEKMKAIREAKLAAAPEPKEKPLLTLDEAIPEDEINEVLTLDLTPHNLVNESSVTELIRRMYDDTDELPDLLKVTTSQMIEIFDPSRRTTMQLDGCIYRSPFGEHWVEVISRKELDRESNQSAESDYYER